MKTQPMAFCHSKGFAPAWDMVQRYIQQGGQIATMPHIVAARMATSPLEAPWETWFTTLSAEYVGTSRGGAKLLIVAHGAGPLAAKDGILAAYRDEFAGKSGQRIGRISMREFRKLENGHYGSVSIVDLGRYLRNANAFSIALRGSQAEGDVVLYARLGEGVARYLMRQTAFARAWHQRAKESLHQNPPLNMGLEELQICRDMHQNEMQDPYLVQLYMGAFSYRRALQADEVLAHLLTITPLRKVSVDGIDALTFGVGLLDWSGGFRFVGVPKGAEMAALHPGWNYREQVAKNWIGLMVRLARPAKIGFRELVRLGDNFFTVRTEGFISGVREPQFRVTKMKPLGTSELSLSVRGSDSFFAYDLREIRDAAPSGASGFTFGKIQAIKDDAGSVIKYRAAVTFYDATVYTSQQLRRESDVQDDYDTQMLLLNR